ncbi:MAG TPA: hypothetical protein VH008_07590 [Pseudonocardia sp.]|nr:hypothetical protein [Pseudonocardia sp.]
MAETMSVDGQTVVRLTSDGSSAEVDLVGARLLDFSFAGRPYWTPGAVGGGDLAVLDADARVAPLVAGDALWRVADHTGGTLTLITDSDDLPCVPAIVFSVGSWGLVVAHAITNSSDRPVTVGIAAQVHPHAGDTPVLSVVGEAPEHCGDLVGAESAAVPGRATAGAEFDVLVGGARTVPGGHITHQLAFGGDRAGDGMRIWGDEDFAWTRAVSGGDTVRLELRTHVAGGAPPAWVIDPGQSRGLYWGLQPFEAHAPKS